MDTYINVLQIQLDRAKQSNKHMKGARGEKGKLKGGIILTNEILRMEIILKETLNNLAKNGIDVERCREGIIAK